MKNNIEILSSHEIDKIKWNTLVNDSKNGLVYAQSDFLDRMADNWAAVIVGDYESILPIPYRKKWGISYSYSVPFVQQLGLIGKVEDAKAAKIKSEIQKKFKYGTIQLNSGNAALAAHLGASPMPNMYISLQEPFSVLEKNFKKEVFRVSEKLIKDNWLYNSSIHAEECINLYRRMQGHKMKHIRVYDFERLIQFCNENKNTTLQYFARAVQNRAGEICSVVLLLKDRKRIYNIINASTTQGRKAGTNYMLYYECLKEFSQQPILFDFEGSAIPGVAGFYNKFNPRKEFYHIWHYNALPFPLSMFP